MTLEYRCSHCGTLLQTTNADPMIAAAPRLVRALKIFLGEDERFQVAVGGNPLAVDKMLDDIRALVAKAEGK